MTPPSHFKLTRPRALKAGDTLGVVAPASPFDRQAFDTGIAALDDMGFNLVIPDEIYKKNGFLAGSDRCRAELLNRLFADPGIDGIICARGGYGAMRILSMLDADRIAAHPKVFVGFSDITAVLSYLVAHCHMVAFHGPTVTTLGKADPTTRDQFLSALTRTAPLSLAASPGQVLQSGSATGRFLCGNLTLFCHLTGTPYRPDFDGAILMLEDQGEAPYRIDRMLTQMLMAGCFDRIAGLALGNFNHCAPADQIHRIVVDRLGGLKIPILAGFEVGHTAVNMTLPLGGDVTLDTRTATLAFTGSALR